MDLRNLNVTDYYLFEDIHANTPLEVLFSDLEHYEAYIQTFPDRKFYAGFNQDIMESVVYHEIVNWNSRNPQVTLFYYFRLIPKDTISENLSNTYIQNHQELHILPSSDLYYGRYKDELWDLHLAGYQIFIHHADRIKSFRNNPIYYQKLSNRGVIIGVKPHWNYSWIGNQNKKIVQLILNQQTHFFNTTVLDITSEAFQKEQESRKFIIDQINFRD
jgi:hypothetical protein